MKEKITSAPVLVFPDFNKPFLLETDASKEGLGAVLSQKQDDGCYHPVAFGSRMLTPSEQNYHSSKLEFLALKWSITEHFKEYLAYAPFTVCTDNNPSVVMKPLWYLGFILVLERFSMFIFQDLRAFQQLEFNYII